MIFISIPKCASYAVQTALAIDISKNNHRATHMIKGDDKRIAIIRNPLDRLVSWFYWHTNEPISIYKTTFKKWVLSGCPHHWSDELLETTGVTSPLIQCDFIDENVGLFLYENLNKDWKKIAAMAGKPNARLNIMQSSSHPHYTTLYTPEMIKVVSDLFTNDVLLYKGLL